MYVPLLHGQLISGGQHCIGRRSRENVHEQSMTAPPITFLSHLAARPSTAFSRGNEWETWGRRSPSLTKDRMASILASLILGCRFVWIATGQPSTCAPFIMIRLVGRVFAEV